MHVMPNVRLAATGRAKRHQAQPSAYGVNFTVMTSPSRIA